LAEIERLALSVNPYCRPPQVRTDALRIHNFAATAQEA